MMTCTTRPATVADTDDLARPLHAFNTEFGTASPGAEVLAPRLRTLLAAASTFAVLARAGHGDAVGCALVTMRPNVWFDGPVALLDELYVVPHLRNHQIGTALMHHIEAECRARRSTYVEINVDSGDTDTRRFYERLGYSDADESTGAPAIYYSRELQAD